MKSMHADGGGGVGEVVWRVQLGRQGAHGGAAWGGKDTRREGGNIGTGRVRGGGGTRGQGMQGGGGERQRGARETQGACARGVGVGG